MYCWKDTINLIMDLFEVRQTTIAEQLNISKGTLSKIKNGKQSLALSVDHVYRTIFDPANKSSLAKNTAKFYLADLKKILEDSYPHIKEDLTDCWASEDYKEFVLCLLNRTRRTSCIEATGVSRKDVDEPANNITCEMANDVIAPNTSIPESSIILSFISDETEPSCVEYCDIFSVRMSKEDRICTTCSKWKGDVVEAQRTPGGVYGICKIYNNRDQLSSEGGNCARYTPNLSLLSQRKLSKRLR